MAAAYRTPLVALGTPLANSDEAVLGLVSLHIAQGRDAPVYMCGQDYMGMPEAYLAVPLIRVFGAGAVPLRVPLVVLFALFLAGFELAAGAAIWSDPLVTPGHDTLSALTAISGTSGPGGERLHGALSLGLPMIVNLRPADRYGAGTWRP